MTRIIEVIVSPTGQTKLETRGFTGSSCRDASRFLEQALGIKIEERPTAESFLQAVDNQQVAREGS